MLLLLWAVNCNENGQALCLQLKRFASAAEKAAHGDSLNLFNLIRRTGDVDRAF